MASTIAEEPVMPILVTTEGKTHLDVIRSVSLAVYRGTKLRLTTEMLQTHDPEFFDVEGWFRGGMRKTVRRIKQAPWQKLLIDPQAWQTTLAWDREEGTHVGQITSYPRFKNFQRRAQVSGWDLGKQPDAGSCPSNELAEKTYGTLGPVIAVRSDLSTGKAAAAAAHVASGIALGSRSPSADVLDRLVIKLVDEVDEETSLFKIADSGHTEVEPGTVTAALMAFTKTG